MRAICRNKAGLDSFAVAADGDQLARIVGPEWQSIVATRPWLGRIAPILAASPRR
jgi:hypothetical protein